MKNEVDEAIDSLNSLLDQVNQTKRTLQDYKFQLATAENSTKIAWNEHKIQSNLSSAAFKLLREIREDESLSEESKKSIDSFLGPWKLNFVGGNEKGEAP